MTNTPHQQAPKQELISILEEIKAKIEEAKKPAKALCKEEPSQQYISDFIDLSRNCFEKVINFLDNKDKPEIDDILSSVKKQSEEIDKNQLSKPHSS
jgi:hypothetical protein